MEMSALLTDWTELIATPLFWDAVMTLKAQVLRAVRVQYVIS
jgi:hypothetical protein